MAVENDFLPFATGSGANVLSQASYAALSAISTGYQSGIAQSAALNKTWRQSSIMAAVLAQFIVQQTGQTAIDDGTTATLLANLTVAINAAAKSKVVLTDTGSANAYAAANPVPLTVLPTATGTTQTVKIAHANTGASTYAPDGLATAPIYGLGGALLQGSELPTNGVATLVSFVNPLLNSGSLCWVLYECVGGSQQVAPATASQHAVQLTQLQQLTTRGQSIVHQAAGTYSDTVPAGVYRWRVRGWGGGGGGGGALNAGASASGGGGGGYFDGWLPVTPGQTITTIVGGQGAAGTAAPTNGTAGGNTTITNGVWSITCGGGAGGNQATGALQTTGASGGAVSVGGVTAGTFYTASGSSGDIGLLLTGTVVLNGQGGWSFGSGRPAQITNAAGNQGVGYGCGGAGAAVSGSGGFAGGIGNPGAVYHEY